MVYYKPPNVLKLRLKNKIKIKICSPLVTVDQGGQKNHNGKSSITNYQRVEL
jgi:hypothetical protein